MGAPTKCDAVLTALVVKRIEQGAPPNLAAQAEGIAPQTLSDWNAKASRGQEPYRTYADSVAQARARFTLQRVTNIAHAGFAAGDDGDGSGGDWKADAWLAERADPANFAPSSTIVVKAEERANADVLAAADAVAAAHPEPLTGAQWRLLLLAALSGEDEAEAEHVEH